ncbi:hypothetical protein H2201_002827 [Coniosporium apollinis]|uniref:VLRF1 domain-containing protein n=1 Tax=Coniosporium apollinis TaxID=61459 RepID=A0ABQ9P0D5_9PEZI|nr:hypothetical protein H2201_002827 [Coniosporium apollinis]
MAQKVEKLLERPLYVFDLPEEILVTLALKSQPARAIADDGNDVVAQPEADGTRTGAQEGAPATATSCTLCGLAFSSLQEQRSHIRSDLHGYNLKQKIKGLKPVNEADFERLVGELDESISGSDTSDSDTDEDEAAANGSRPKETTLSALLRKQAKIADPDGDDFMPKKRKRGAGKPPLLWFSSSVLPKDTSLGVYRAIFTDAEQEEESRIVDIICSKQLPPAPPPKSGPLEGGGVRLPSTDIGPHYFLCMIGGGHFAAMIVGLAPRIGKKHTGIDERSATVIAHKTFHRYTTRRKQGGSQSANDSAKGAAHSAGSSLRRYNEAALTNEVRDLLTEWKTMIDTAELIFVRATGSTNRRTLFGPYEGQVLRHNDPRNRGFPFSTRRATQAELMRSFVELTRVKVSKIDEAALAAAAAAEAEAQAQKAATPPRPATPSKPPKPSKEDEAALHTTQIQSLIRRSKAPALLSYLSTNNVSPNFLFHPLESQQNHHAPTPLHLAASLNSSAVVLALLTKGGADPGVKSEDDKTPFDLAGDRATRDAFRIARQELGEERWNWDAANVPSPISKADAEARDKRDRSEADAAEAERRRVETERLRKETEEAEKDKREKRFGKGRVVPEKTGAEKREEEARGMTPEMRARLERERRARAAEERMRRLQGR